MAHGTVRLYPPLNMLLEYTIESRPNSRNEVEVFGDRPRLMRELVLAVIADQPDIEVIGEVQDESALAEAIEEAHPDVLILSLDGADKRIAQCGFLIGQYPHMKVLALAPEQNRGLFYWATVDVRSKPLESSEAGILSALRESPSLVGAVHH